MVKAGEAAIVGAQGWGIKEQTPGEGWKSQGVRQGQRLGGGSLQQGWDGTFSNGY